MKTRHHKIEIDALAAFRKIGVNLDDSPIGGRCVDSLRQQLNRLITTELLIASLRDAAKHKKERPGKQNPVAQQVEPKTGGPAHHEA
jgi:hypothetical protein